MRKRLIPLYRHFFARPRFRKFNTTVLHLGMRGLGILNYENEDVSGERNFIQSVLPEIIDSVDPIFFDIGANVGDYSIKLLETFPNAAIHAFEPHPISFKALEEKTIGYQIHRNMVAVGDSPGQMTLYDRADCTGSSHASLYSEVISELHQQQTKTTEVQVITLDDYIIDKQIPRIDFLKIDTEGNEYSVLQGGAETIKSGKVNCIHFEFNEMNIISRVFFRDFRTLLSGFKLYRLLPNDLLPLKSSALTTELFGYQNIVALKDNLQV